MMVLSTGAAGFLIKLPLVVSTRRMVAPLPILPAHVLNNPHY